MHAIESGQQGEPQREPLADMVERAREKYAIARDQFEHLRSLFETNTREMSQQNRILTELFEKHSDEGKPATPDESPADEPMAARLAKQRLTVEQLRQQTEQNHKLYEQFRELTATRLKALEQEFENIMRTFDADR